MIHDLMREGKNLGPVPQEAALEYEAKSPQMTRDVDQQLALHPAITELIGHNPFAVMHENHRNHAAFMASVFKLNTLELLAPTLVWVYRSYHSRGFAHDYFLVELQAWQSALDKHLSPDAAEPLGNIYRWMVSKHETMIRLSKERDAQSSPSHHPEWQNARNTFLSALLQGDSRESLQMGMKFAHKPSDVENFYLQVVEPCMYTIGSLWEKGEISVAQEHLATALVSRIMAVMSPQMELVREPMGKAVVTASPNEHHELGAWMVADLLRMDGWQVDYLGANTPSADLLEFISAEKPFLVCISVAMPFNLEKTRQLVTGIREAPRLKDTMLMVGGSFFRSFKDMWRATGADGWAPDAKSSVKLAREWRAGRDRQHKRM